MQRKETKISRPRERGDPPPPPSLLSAPGCFLSDRLHLGHVKKLGHWWAEGEGPTVRRQVQNVRRKSCPCHRGAQVSPVTRKHRAQLREICVEDDVCVSASVYGSVQTSVSDVCHTTQRLFRHVTPTVIKHVIWSYSVFFASMFTSCLDSILII